MPTDKHLSSASAEPDTDSSTASNPDLLSPAHSDESLTTSATPTALAVPMPAEAADTEPTPAIHSDSPRTDTPETWLTSTSPSPTPPPPVPTPHAESVATECCSTVHSDEISTAIDVLAAKADPEMGAHPSTDGARSRRWWGGGRKHSKTPDPDVADPDDSGKTAVELMHLRHGPTHAQVDAQHPGEPHPPLSKEELKAFYAFSFAIEPIAVVAISALIPLILQSLAAAHGMAVATNGGEPTTPCDYTQPGYKCVVRIGGAWVDVSSFALYTTAFSVAVQALAFISLGAVADHGGLRKKFMVTFMAATGASCLAFLFVRSASAFWFAALLMVVLNICLGSSFVFYNSYIPIYARSHWYLNRTFPTPAARERALELTANALSSNSYTIGFLGSILCFGVAGGTSFIISKTVPRDSPLALSGFAFGTAGLETYTQQIAVAVVGLWALAVVGWVARRMRTRPGPPLPKGQNYVVYSWKRVGKSVGRCRRLPNTFLFLVAWFFMSDAMTTVGSVTILFAQNELGFSASELTIIAIGAPLTAALGNYLFLRFQQHFRWSTRAVILLLVALMLLLPVYGVLGIFAPFGLRHKWELFPIGVYYGILLGALQSFCRGMFAELLPSGQEAEFFSLYAITDKGSSWFGPLAVAAITDVSHQIRYAFLFLGVMMVVALACVWYINAEKARRDIEKFQEVEHAEQVGEAVQVVAVVA
ncbi:Autophagy protein 22 [Phlyctochytrium bullatum]|nr:Autophagy protein 22 [Phlyctochytrium bullatum]